MPGRKYQAAGGLYRYGFNGKEQDNEVVQYDYGFRIYDSRLVRFKSTDPLTKSYPMLTPYQFASNTPIQAIDLDGLERLDMTQVNMEKRSATITIVHNVQLLEDNLPNELHGLSTENYSKSFRNTTVYTKNLPSNGETIEFTTEGEYSKSSGFALNIVFDVKLSYISKSEQRIRGPENSFLYAQNREYIFSGNDAFALSSANTDNAIAVNSNFNGFESNGGGQINETYEELIAHETGYHNMMGQLHKPDPQNPKLASYPSPGTITLESRVHNEILSTPSNVQQILITGITIRKNLLGPTVKFTPETSADNSNVPTDEILPNE